MWYIVQVGTGNEAHMKELLENFIPRRLISHVFYPLYESSYKKGGMRQIIKKPLFPGYLFLESGQSETLDDYTQLKSVKELEKYLKRITEFHHLLTTGKVCIPVSEAEQNFLTEHTDQKYVMVMSRGYMVDREVTITEGAFAGYQGQLKYVDRHNRYGVMPVKLGDRNIDMRFGLEIVEK